MHQTVNHPQHYISTQVLCTCQSTYLLPERVQSQRPQISGASALGRPEFSVLSRPSKRLSSPRRRRAAGRGIGVRAPTTPKISNRGSSSVAALNPSPSTSYVLLTRISTFSTIQRHHYHHHHRTSRHDLLRAILRPLVLHVADHVSHSILDAQMTNPAVA